MNNTPNITVVAYDMTQRRHYTLLFSGDLICFYFYRHYCIQCEYYRSNDMFLGRSASVCHDRDSRQTDDTRAHRSIGYWRQNIGGPLKTQINFLHKTNSLNEYTSYISSLFLHYFILFFIPQFGEKNTSIE